MNEPITERVQRPAGPPADRVVVAVTVGAPADAVWHALRDVASLHRWHGWDYPDLDAEIEQIYHGDATVADEDDRTLETGAGRFELTETTAGTRVRVLRSGEAEGYDEIDEGWTTFVHQLRFYLERHLGRQRRTVRVEGASPPDVEREVWFESAHQRGLAVPEWGDALMVVSTPPEGSGSILVSGYDLDDASWREIEESVGQEGDQSGSR